MKSAASTVGEYLSGVDEERRKSLDAVRDVILQNLDSDYEELMQCGMIAYVVPHRVFPAGYHCDPRQPLQFAALAAQKNHMALYLMPLYSTAAMGKETAGGKYFQWFGRAWSATGKKLDMGKSCIRFKSAEDLPLDVIGEAIRRIPAKRWIEIYTTMMSAVRLKRPKPSAKPRHAASSR